MTPLRKRLLEDMQLRCLAPGTQATYVRSICRLADYYHKSPDLITEPELRDYVMELNAGKLVKRTTAKLQLCGIKFFFRNTLQRRWPSLALMRSPKGRRLPVVLSPEEVWRILEAVRFPVYRVCLTTIYTCGLRVSEGIALQVSSVDSSIAWLSFKPNWLHRRPRPKHPRNLQPLPPSRPPFQSPLAVPNANSAT